jgi:osmoprotectant transport system ATP-binding protein
VNSESKLLSPGPPAESAAGQGQPAIQLQGVSKRYGNSVALHPTDLEFPAGQTTVLIGPSGCGKSTILRLINGLLEPSTGQVLLGGEALTRENLLRTRRRMGYMIQEGGLFPHLTARENVLLLGTHLSRSPKELRARLEELCGLTRFPLEALERFPVELSGGQRQRVSLIRALMLKPDFLLLDEPLAALDPIVRVALQTELKALFQHLRQTVVFVTHELAEAAYLGHQLVLMKQGRVVQAGTLAALREHPAESFVLEFINAQRGLVLP